MAKIIKGSNDFVEITFSGVDLTAFTRVEATFGADTRDSVADPSNVVVVNATTLRLFFGDTAETSKNYWTITGYDLSAPLGVTLTSKCVGNLPATRVCGE
jgi:hypothetical protein